MMESIRKCAAEHPDEKVGLWLWPFGFLAHMIPADSGGLAMDPVSLPRLGLPDWARRTPREVIFLLGWSRRFRPDHLHRYQGDMNRKKRDQVVRVFMAKDKATVMLMSLKCGGVGLNLTRANRTSLIFLFNLPHRWRDSQASFLWTSAGVPPSRIKHLIAFIDSASKEMCWSKG